MNLFGFSRRRSETLLLAIGQLILIAYVFQIAALDHWGTNVSEVAGVVGSSEHAAAHDAHCHGAPSSCADAGGGFAQFSPDQELRLPVSTPSLVLETDAGSFIPEDALVAILPEPPRTSV